MVRNGYLFMDIRVELTKGRQNLNLIYKAKILLVRRKTKRKTKNLHISLM